MGSSVGRTFRVMHTDPSRCRAAQRHQDGRIVTGHAHVIVPQRRRECTQIHGMNSPVFKAHSLTARLDTNGDFLGDHSPDPVWSTIGFGILRELRRGHEDTPPFHDFSRCVPVLVFPQRPFPRGRQNGRFVELWVGSRTGLETLVERQLHIF